MAHRRSEDPIRVLVIDHAAGRSGAEGALARLLSTIDRDRFDARVLLLEDGPLVQALRADRVRTVVLPAPAALLETRRGTTGSPRALAASAGRTAALIPRLVRAIRGSGAELVVASSLKSAVLTGLAAPLAGRPWVWHLHDRIASDYLPGPAVRGLRILAARGPRAVVANSRATRATLPGVPDERITVAYPGLPIPRAATATDRRPASSSPVFGLLGRIAPTKGQLEFLEAAALLDPVLGARFRVIGDALFGDAPYAAEVRALAARRGLDERVTFPGWVEDPRTELRLLTAMVHASPVPEPFGQVVVEAMLAGVPVIAARAGGVLEILDPDGSAREVAPGVALTPLGVLVAPGDPGALARAMSWVTAHPEETERRAAAARTSAADRFDIRTSAGIVGRVWTDALRGGRR